MESIQHHPAVFFHVLPFLPDDTDDTCEFKRRYHAFVAAAAAASAFGGQVMQGPSSPFSTLSISLSQPTRNHVGAFGDIEPKEDDIVIQQEGARLMVDELSMTFLEDCEIDYTEEMIRASFSVVKNKLADSKCGCGSSFSVASF
eukprot:s1202_g18.t1